METGRVIWVIGLSGSGKTTIAAKTYEILRGRGICVVFLDGDILRKNLNKDLGFAEHDRDENIRRAAAVASILVKEGLTVVAAFITPREHQRRAVRSLFDGDQYFEIYLDCPPEICEQRDPKGLYKLARAGQISEFTGISSPFEIPACADLWIPTGRQTIEESVAMLLDFIEPHTNRAVD